jgi:hypothetical protein
MPSTKRNPKGKRGKVGRGKRTRRASLLKNMGNPLEYKARTVGERGRIEKERLKQLRGTRGTRGRTVLGRGTYGQVVTPPYDTRPREDGRKPFSLVTVRGNTADPTLTVVSDERYPTRDFNAEGFVSKRFMNNNSAIDELLETTKIDNMDPGFVWHLESVGVFVPTENLGSRAGSSAVSSPNEFNKAIVDGDGGIIQVKNGGKSVKDVRTFTEADVPRLRSLAQGIDAMSKAGFLHLDIKPHNVMAGDPERDGVADFNFIDFGLSSSVEDVRSQRDYLLKSTYFVYPIEFGLIGAGRGKSSLERIAKMSNVSSAHIYINSSRNPPPGSSRYANGLVKNLYNMYDISSSAKFITENDDKTVFDKVDVFGLGQVFGDVYRKIYGKTAELKKVNKEDFNMYPKLKPPVRGVPPSATTKDKLHSLITQMSHPSWVERISGSELLAEFDRLFPEAAGAAGEPRESEGEVGEGEVGEGEVGEGEGGAGSEVSMTLEEATDEIRRLNSLMVSLWDEIETCKKEKNELMAELVECRRANPGEVDPSL